MMEMLCKAVGLCLVTAAAATLLKRDEPVFALLLTLAAALTGGALLLSAASDAMAMGEELIALTGLSPALFLPLLKVIAAALITRVASALCADAGQSALARMTETAGAFCALGCAMPLVHAVVDLIRGWL
ncbi:MAG: stage III sporulation AC/AD family protein [Oscillospiraceae bacterium]|nr:stage III sporulation AC/AD family protein [Oscillospiraceae bacterium]